MCRVSVAKIFIETMIKLCKMDSAKFLKLLSYIRKSSSGIFEMK